MSRIMFEGIPKENVALIKADGRIIEGIKAHVQTKLIFISDASIPIEENDVITRTLPNGLIERYVVIERGFHQIPKPHYQVKVQKESRVIDKHPSTVIYNLLGAHSRVNVNSSDNSVNVININSQEVFSKMEQITEGSSLDRGEKDLILKSIEDMKEMYGSNNFLSRYQAFIATAANHLTLFLHLLPALSQMLR